jgi:histidine phosphotransferase ChpT
MSVAVELRVLELLSSRLCHELISPVGAVNNGIELMDEDDPDFVKEAMQLIGNSARTAGRRLDFYRFAYGSGRAGTGRDVTLGLLEGGKARCVWNDAVSALAVEWQRLASNMVVLAAEALPRGGEIEVSAASGKPGVVVKGTGDAVNLTAELRAVFDGTAATADLTARTVHAYYTSKLAEALGTKLTLAEPSPGSVTFTAA